MQIYEWMYSSDTNKIRKRIIRMQGFSIMEIIVVMAIMVTVASLILANYPGFNERLAVRGASEEIASSLRQAQAYGLGVKEFVPGSQSFPGYGLYFQRVDPVTGLPSTSYVFFADKNKDFLYTDSSEKISNMLIQGGVYIYDLCANQKQIPAGPCSLASLNVVYTRPAPQVSLKSGSLSYSDLEVKIKGPKGTAETIVIWLSGEVSVE